MSALGWNRSGEVLDWPALDDGEGYVATVQPTVRHADPRCVEMRGSRSWVPDHGDEGRWYGDLPVCKVCAPTRQQQVCPTCHLAMRLTGECGNCS